MFAYGEYSRACRLQASLTRSARRVRTQCCAFGRNNWVEAAVRGIKKQTTDWWSGSCLRQFQGALPRWNGTRMFAYGEYSHACRLRASSTRSARRVRTQCCAFGRSNWVEAAVRGDKKTDHHLMVCFFMAAELGFEPRHTESESAVLPLHNSAIASQAKTILPQKDAFVNTFLKKSRGKNICKRF